ncbi:MAG TPA: AAA family ATPase [Gammaproteobacteria bacterium]|nr:AAA family ATPase [Gammaproteobacteria bacterium]
MAEHAYPQPIDGLLRPAAYPHPVDRIHVIETHISWVVLTGEYAYKVKKPVDLGFVDFSTPARRRRACEDELRLNRRLAASIYLDVVPLCGSPARPRVGEPGEEGFEHAVRMRQFPEDARLDRELEEGRLSASDMDEIAAVLSAFHDSLPPAAPDSARGEPGAVYATMRDNFEAVDASVAGEREAGLLRQVEEWTASRYEAVRPRLAARRREGFIRECHGDLHLGNLARVDGRILPFDCIEFSESLRWIDVISEVAFLWMDLRARGRDDLASRFLNSYLAAGGDYEGLPLLRFYAVYRAMVRVKVAAIRLSQGATDDAGSEAARQDLRAHLALAGRLCAEGRGAILITTGLSGSGKSHLAGMLAMRLPAVRVRSDVERKRLYGLPPGARSGSGVATGIYTPEAGRRTYARLREIAGVVAGAGMIALVDAAFLERSQRAAMRTLADELDVPFLALECRARPAALRERVRRRARQGADPSEADIAVLERQLAGWRPLADSETSTTIRVDTEGDIDVDRVSDRVRRVIDGARAR